ncbi:MAG: lysophospholipid acyltransferase family protein [Tannerella sp.]|jgi:putative hemolysin|nr:lysophospholipid acyltransferase family protein [Tannerella sp.]
MKKTVLDIQDFQKISPFFRNKAAVAFMKKVFKWCSVDKVNQIHSNHCHLRGSEFTSAILADPLIDIKYTIHHEERLDTLPEGAFVTVSNHPIGSLDGIMLIDIFASRRKDFCVMTNNTLMKIGAMADNFIPIKPKTTKDEPVIGKNINGVRASIARLKDGHPMGFFPAGAMSFYDKEKRVRDLPWTHNVIRLIRKTKTPVYPVYFDCRNSNFFYWLGNVSWKLRTFRIPVEAFNKQGQTLDVYIGEQIPPHVIQQYSDDFELATFLYNTTYGLKEQG